MAVQTSPSIKLLFLTAGTLIALLVFYLWLLPAFPDYANGITFLAWIGLLVCFAGSAAITFSTQDPRRSNLTKVLVGSVVGLALTMIVFVTYLAIATAMRGA